MFKISWILLALVPLALSLVLSLTLFSQTESADSFDRPLQKKVLDFGPPPNYIGGNLQVEVSCYFYPTFIVKEYDGRGKSLQWHAIVPSREGAVPACTRNAAGGERRIDEGGWSGYFKGVKGNLVFINAPDGADGGMQFYVYDSTTGKKIFEDSARESSKGNKKGEDFPFDQMRFSSSQDGQLYLRYLRVVEAGCDLHLEKTPCWERTRHRLDLKSAQMPVCSEYEGISDREVSVVAYPVEVFLFPQPSTKTIAGPVKCWPVD